MMAGAEPIGAHTPDSPSRRSGGAMMPRPPLPGVFCCADVALRREAGQRLATIIPRDRFSLIVLQNGCERARGSVSVLVFGIGNMESFA